MKTAFLIARIFLGLNYFVFGLNFYLHFIPLPPFSPEAASFFGALIATGYMLPLVKVIEVVCGLLLLSKNFVPLALVLLAPISINILLFHTFLDLKGAPLAIVIIVAHGFLTWAYRDQYRPMLARVTE